VGVEMGENIHPSETQISALSHPMVDP